MRYLSFCYGGWNRGFEEKEGKIRLVRNFGLISGTRPREDTSEFKAIKKEEKELTIKRIKI